MEAQHRKPVDNAKVQRCKGERGDGVRTKSLTNSSRINADGRGKIEEAKRRRSVEAQHRKPVDNAKVQRRGEERRK